MNEQQPAPEPYPFLLKLVVAFFAVDAVLKCIILFCVPEFRYGALAFFLGANHFAEHPEIERLLVPTLFQQGIYFSMLVIVVFDMMLVVQLFLRSSAGRTWALIFSAGAAFWAGYLMCFDPVTWIGRGDLGRMTVFAFLAIYVLIFIYLLRPRLKEIFTN
jgi:hypothetical protein